VNREEKDYEEPRNPGEEEMKKGLIIHSGETDERAADRSLGDPERVS
jgi:hypothetical protein